MMNTEMLQTFHQEMLPLLTPQSEKLLDSLQPEQFQQIAFRFIFSAEAMARVSHIMQDMVAADSGQADLHLSFQPLLHLFPPGERYRQVVAAAKGVWLYGETGSNELEIPTETTVRLIDTGNTLLTRYWFVVAYGAGSGLSLLAEQVSALSGEDRYYEGFYSFEPEVAYQLVAILHHAFPDQVPLPAAPT
jgi:hypothetical protein